MRYEAKHQAVKRKFKSMGFRNVDETIPKLMNESRRNELEKLIKIQNKDVEFKRGFHFFGKVGADRGVFKSVSSKAHSVKLLKIETKFDKRLLAYMVLSSSDHGDNEKRTIEVYSGGLLTTYNEQEFVFFNDYFE